MKVVRINIDGTMNDLDISLKKKGLLKQLEEHTTSKGTSNFTELYKWNHENHEIICYGWYDGDAGFENKHDLIPNGNSSFLCEEDSSEKLLFGDIILVCYQEKKFKDFEVLDYAGLYEIMFEGFDDCNTDDDDQEEEEDEEPNTDDEDFIVNDDEYVDSNESYEYSDEELDEDTNEY